jgi:hypothetical protein
VGNGASGRAWDKILTDGDGPYIELMAGAYSDNQPDYSWLQPYETRSFTMSWYPFHAIGGVKKANLEAAVNLEAANGSAKLGFYTTAAHAAVQVRMQAAGKTLFEQTVAIDPAAPFVKTVALPAGIDEHDLTASITDGGRELVSYSPIALTPQPMPKPVTGAAAEIGITVERYVDALVAGAFDLLQRGGLPAPIGLPSCLKMRDLEPATGAPRQFDLLVYGLHQPHSIIPHMGGIDLAAASHDAAEPLQLVEWRAFAGRVHQTARQAAGARNQRFVQQPLHRLQLRFRQRPEARAGNRDSQSAVPDQGYGMDQPRFCSRFRQVLRRRTPTPGIAAVEDSIGKFVKGTAVRGRGIGRKTAVADHLGGDAL